MGGSRYSIAIFGLSITSSWGNGHATTYRGLVRELSRQGHEIVFYERNKPWYAQNRDLPNPPYGKTVLYDSLEELQDHAATVRSCDFVMLGSYVPDGIAIGSWILQTARGATGFYDIDTPVTLARLAAKKIDYLCPEMIPRFDLYLSFTGGPMLAHIEKLYGARRALPLYCSVDPALYYPENNTMRWDIGYMGTYSADRQPPLNRLLLLTAQKWRQGRFIVAGPLYPISIAWPENVDRVEHIQPDQHRDFYTSQRFTLNITRADMVAAGYSPSVRLFEAAACGTPIISDFWEGLDSFFKIGAEILVSGSPEQTLQYLRTFTPEECRGIGERARSRVLGAHTAAHRASELAGYIGQALERN